MRTITDTRDRPEPRLLRSDDLISCEAFERRREGLLRSSTRLRQRRRCRVSPHVTLSFENRETVLWHVQEIMRLEGRTAQHQIEEELSRYDCLVPRTGELRATVMIDGGSWETGQRLSRQIAENAEVLMLRVGTTSCFADCVESRPLMDSPLRYVRFAVGGAGVCNADFARTPVELALLVEPYTRVTASPSLCEALAEDLGAAEVCGPGAAA